MDGTVTPIIILAVVAIVAVGGILALRENKRRRGALSTWVSEHGWSLSAKGSDLEEGRKGFPFRRPLEVVQQLATGSHNGTPSRLYVQDFPGHSDPADRSRWLFVSLTLARPTPSVSFIRSRTPDGGSLPAVPPPAGYHTVTETPLGDEWTVIVEDEGDRFLRQLLDAGIGDLLSSERLQHLAPVPIIVYSGREVSLVTNDRLSFDFVDPALDVLEEFAAEADSSEASRTDR